MGSDIHIVIQRQDESGAWREIVYQDALRDYEVGRRTLVADVPVAPACFSERNYPLFGALAGVRWDTKPISTPRGLPEGFDVEQVAPDPECDEKEPRWLGDHSFSWLTLDELLAYDWKELAKEPFGWRIEWPDVVLPWLAQLADGRPLRLVFGFDS